MAPGRLHAPHALAGPGNCLLAPTASFTWVLSHVVLPHPGGPTTRYSAVWNSMFSASCVSSCSTLSSCGGVFPHPRELPQPLARLCGGVLHSRGASTAAGPPLRGVLHSRGASTAAGPPLRGRFSSLPRSFHSFRPRSCGGFSSTPRGLPQPSFRPCGGFFSPPGSFHSRRFCGNFFVLYVYKTKKCFFRIHFLVQNMFSRVNKLVVSANSG